MTNEAMPDELSSDTRKKSRSWATAATALRERYPKATEGILFCVYKLEQDPTLTIPDFREEGQAHGIRLGGRALHSAKALLGLNDGPSRRQPSSTSGARPAARKAARRPAASAQSLEDQVMRAITEIQESATNHARRLREAMREAVHILQKALDS